MSEQETLILNLFESYWFEYGVFTSKPPFPFPFSTPKPTQIFQKTDDEPELNRVTTLMRRSHSDQFLSSNQSDTDSASPKSVLGPQLRTILSGKQVESFDDSVPKLDEIALDSKPQLQFRDLKPEFRERRARRRVRRIKGSRSLSELEIEELKGFMDLGFVFSDEDKDYSRLVSIIPGLQRFGKNVQDAECGVVSRPYLSEAWDSLELDQIDVRMDLRIPAFGNEMELKDHLRCWAHNVASAVR